MKQRASSGQTFLYKYIYTGIVIGGAGWYGITDDSAWLPVLFWLACSGNIFLQHDRESQKSGI